METNREEPMFSGIDFSIYKDKSVLSAWSDDKFLTQVEINFEKEERYQFMLQELNNFYPAPTQKEVNHFILKKIAELQVYLKQHALAIIKAKNT